MAAVEEVTLPKATVQKIIKDMLPQGVKCSNDTRDLIVECCVEFIHLVASEANDICTKDNKKTIGPRHIISALQALGFDEYVGEVSEVNRELETAEKPKKTKKTWESLGISQEQLLADQRALFAKARSALNSSRETSSLTGSASPTGVTPTSTTTSAMPPPPSINP